ncbi:MAG: NAD(P)-binding protein, partial [Pseudomonadota bacterium]
MSKSPKKIAILGGGIAGLSAAFHLTNQPDWQKHYEITLYQMGWRLGGKAASGLNTDIADRIEEHGIHLFGNMYVNSLSLVNDCLKEVKWEKDEPRAFFNNMENVFLRSNHQIVTEYPIEGETAWKQLPMKLPHTGGIPWTDDFRITRKRLAIWHQDMVRRLTGALLKMLKTPEVFNFINDDAKDKIHPLLFTSTNCRNKDGSINKAKVLDGQMKEYLGKLYGLFHGSQTEIPKKASQDLRIWLRDIDAVGRRIEAGLIELGVKPIPPKKMSYARRCQYFGKLLDEIDAFFESNGLGHVFEWTYVKTDFYNTLIKGVFKDNLFKRGLDSLDDEQLNYTDWMAKHGLNQRTQKSALMRVITNVCFAYSGGDTEQLPKMSATCFLMFLLRQMFAHGHAIHFFQGGTGGTIITPIYRVLKQRGVKFEFFHKVLDIEPDKANKRI